MSMVDARNFQSPRRSQIHRKPLPPPPPTTNAAPASQPQPRPQPQPQATAIQPQTSYPPQHNMSQQQGRPYQQPQQMHRVSLGAQPQSFSHSRTRTSSSGVLPQVPPASQGSPPPIQESPPPAARPAPGQATRQYSPEGARPVQSTTAPSTASAAASAASTATYVASRTAGNNVPVRQNSGASSSLERSTSSRSGSSPSTYVAAMRKQKATVWSDRAQYEDPRTKTQQRIAKMHARKEMSSSAAGAGGRQSSSSSITGGVRSKIRHHGAPKAQYAPATLSAAGVPIRLSQNEIDEDDSDDGSQPGAMLHRRTDSGRSSVGSAGRASGAYGWQGQQATSQSMAASSEEQEAGIGAEEETPVPDDFQGSDYFSNPNHQQQQAAPGTLARQGSGGSSSTDRENSFGAVGELPQRAPKQQSETLDPAELRRRGSVDERTMTMSGYGKLFVANPDVDD